MKQVNITVDDGLLESIDESADELNISRSEWFREAARNKLQYQE